MWNADHRLEESTIQSVSLPCALSGRGGICQVKTVANSFWGAWNTDKKNQVWRMRADLDHSNCDILLRLHASQEKHLSFHSFLLALDIMKGNASISQMIKTSLRKWIDVTYSHHTSLLYTDLCATTPALFALYFIKINTNYISSMSADMLQMFFHATELMGICKSCFVILLYCMSALTSHQVQSSIARPVFIQHVFLSLRHIKYELNSCEIFKKNVKVFPEYL